MSNVIQAIKTIYPDIIGGLLYWETKQDGTPWDNPEDGLIWSNTEYEKPSWADIEEKLPAIDLKVLQDAKLLELEKLRDSNLVKYVSHSKGNFPATKMATSLLGARISQWNGAATEEWRDINYTMVDLTLEESKEVVRVISLAHTPVYKKEGVIGGVINAITDLTELQAYDVKTKWDES